jgi:hypothetical protein
MSQNQTGPHSITHPQSARPGGQHDRREPVEPWIAPWIARRRLNVISAEDHRATPPPRHRQARLTAVMEAAKC